MALSERLRRSSSYAKGIVGKATGMGIYQENQRYDKVRKMEGSSGLYSLLSVPLTLFPTAICGGAISKENESSIKTMARILGGFGVDLVPLAVPAILATITHEPSFYWGFLGKPVVNAAVWVAYDIRDRREFKKKTLSTAEEGTYNFLEQAYKDYYDPKLKRGIVKSDGGQLLAVIRKEEVCAESGGSCMVFYLNREKDGKIWKETAHVTDKDIVATSYSSKSPSKRPQIGELIVSLKQSLISTPN